MSKQRFAVVVIKRDPTHRSAPVVVDTLATFGSAGRAKRFEMDLYGAVVGALNAQGLDVAIVGA